MRRSFPHAVRTIGRWAAISGALSMLLFIAAGTTHLASLRAYLTAFSLLLLVTMLAVDPSLACERAQPGEEAIRSESRFLAGLLFLLTLGTAALFVGRTEILAVSFAVRRIALAIFIASGSIQTWAMTANPFFSPVVRLQHEHGHRLIDSGPYRFVRHPGYLAMCIAVPASAAAIGSWAGLFPAMAFVFVIHKRAQVEEQFLRIALAGYIQYAHRTPAGLIGL